MSAKLLFASLDRETSMNAKMAGLFPSIRKGKAYDNVVEVSSMS